MVLLALVPVVHSLRSTAGRPPGGRLPVSAPPVVDDAVVPGALGHGRSPDCRPMVLALVPESPLIGYPQRPERGVERR